MRNNPNLINDIRAHVSPNPEQRRKVTEYLRYYKERYNVSEADLQLLENNIVSPS